MIQIVFVQKIIAKLKGKWSDAKLRKRESYLIANSPDQAEWENSEKERTHIFTD
jgi:hypothetical protein